MQSQAPLMQVAQSQGAGVRRNPKLAAKRKLEAAAKARQPQAQQQQAQAQVQQLLPMQQQQAQPQAQQGKAPLMPMAPAPQPTTSASMRPSSSLSMSSQSLYVDSPPSGGCGDQGEDDYYGGEEPTNKRQKRLVKNRQAAQLFRKVRHREDLLLSSEAACSDISIFLPHYSVRSSTSLTWRTRWPR